MALPILNDALAALDTIKEADINYIKKLGNPPGAIKLVGDSIGLDWRDSPCAGPWGQRTDVVTPTGSTWNGLLAYGSEDKAV